MNGRILRLLHFDPRSGFTGLRELQRVAHKKGISRNETSRWYHDQAVHQMIVPKREKIWYHKTIGNGHGYQADIIFLPHPELNDGLIGLLTFINTSTRRAWIASIRNRSTIELKDKIELWIMKVEKDIGKIRSIATDNEFYKNNTISQMFEDYGIEHFVEVAGLHSKLGIINRFHRTLRDLLTKMMVHFRSDRWVDFIADAIHNYNWKKNRVLGVSPMEMSDIERARLNRRLMIENRESVSRLDSFHVGD